MRATPFSIATLLCMLALLITPILAAPPVVNNGGATYEFSISVQSGVICYGTPSSTTSIVKYPLVCPMIADFLYGANGTIGWRTVNVNDSTAILNDTVTVGSGLSELPTITRSFLESVNLGSRQVSFPFFPFTEVGSFGDYEGLMSSYGVNMTSVTDAMSLVGPLYTIWWVNVPLSLGDTVNVLGAKPVVNGSETVDLGDLGSRDAWTLAFGRSRVLGEMPCAIDSCSYAGSQSTVSASFDYEKVTGTLLTANFDFNSQTIVSTYDYSQNTGAYTTNLGRGITVHASLKLVSLSQPFSTVNTDPANNKNSIPGDNRAPTGYNPLSQAPGGVLTVVMTPRSLGGIAVGIALIGVLGLVIFRRSRTGSKTTG